MMRRRASERGARLTVSSSFFMATFADRIELKTHAPVANGSYICPCIDSAMPKRIRLRRVLAERREKSLAKKLLGCQVLQNSKKSLTNKSTYYL